MAVDVPAKFREWREHPATMVRELFGIAPDPWQEEILEAFPHHQRMALLASKGPGKALALSTVVETPTGRRVWGDLRPGDWLFAEDGTPTRIKQRYDVGEVEVYRVKFTDNTSTVCCGDHLWKVKGRTERRKELGWAVVPTKELIRRGVRISIDKAQFEIPVQGPVVFPERELPIDPYLLGVWLGDGSKGTAMYTKPDLEVEAELNRRGVVTARRPNDPVRVDLPGLRGTFSKLDVFQKGSHERYVPTEYLYSSVQQRVDILCGLMDTDGAATDRSMSYSTSSPQLAEDVAWLVRSLGGFASIREKVQRGSYLRPDGERRVCRLSYAVSVRTTFNPFRGARKRALWRDPNRNSKSRAFLTRYVERIEPAGREAAMCVEVDHPSHCYLANDFIVTHNTCVLAWLAWNFLLTRPTPKLAATSISGQNLADNFWSEMAKWQNKAPLLKAMFEWTKTRIFLKESPEEWWMSARTWPASGDATQQADTLAGLHADYIMFILDESGGMPEAIMASAEAALSSCIEGHILQAGNPTQLSGPLYSAAKKDRKLWYVVEINGDPDNPKRSPRISVQWAREQIEKYGRDNPWVLVNVFGRFPPSSMNALIGVDEVEAAMGRYYREYEIGNVPKVMGVDVARFGDDSSAIAKRQGIQMFPFQTYRNLDSTQGASIVTRAWDEFGADGVFIDATGGFGSGWEDQLRLLGRAPIGVQFAGTAHNKLKYYNKRAEMAFDFVDWIKKGGALPRSEGLKSALTQTLYTFQGDRLLLEPKEVVKVKLGGMSPDEFDAAILTFSEPVSIQASRPRSGRHTFSWEPFGADVDRAARHEYDPFA